MKKTLLPISLAALVLGLTACGGGSSQGGSTSQSQPSTSQGGGQSGSTQESKINLTIDKATIKVGETAKVTSDVEGVEFSSRDESIATVDANGVVTAVKAGETKIQARKDGYKVGSVDIKVEKADAKAADFYLEFEDAEHYVEGGVWGFPMFGMAFDTPVEETASAHGGKSVGWLNAGCKETIYFTSDKAGKIEMDFMMAYNSEVALEPNMTITVNGTALSLSGKSVLGPSDGDANNYYDFNPINFKDVDVKAGENKIIVEIINSGVNLDCVQVYTKELKIEQIVKEAAKPVSIGTVDYYVNGFEFGPAITGVLAHFSGEVSSSDLENFVVKTNGKQRIVKEAYIADTDGKKSAAAKGTDVYFELEVVYTSTLMQWGDWTFPSSDDGGSSPFVYNNMNDWNPNLKISVGIASGKSVKIGTETYGDDKPGIAEEIGKRYIPCTKDWGEAKTHTANGKTLSYKAYETDVLRNDGVKDPLIIWLHGAGEGGTDPDIALLGNDVTNLGEEKVQSHFVKDSQKGAYVLAVQTPTMWMDNGNGQNHGGNEHSVYTETLKSTIDKFIEDNGDIDTGRIFLGGCSNGGYMTMEMALTYPSFFKAYYPTCEAYMDSFVTDENIATLKNLSMWFTHASNDGTVDPNNFTIPTYKRVMEAGASDVHFSYFVDVQGNEGNPQGMNQYNGHYSWIYVLKDECTKDQADPNNISIPSNKDVLVNGNPVSLWGWIASK